MVAAGIALPLVLHQMTTERAGEPTHQPTAPQPERASTRDRRSGILIAALALPITALVMLGGYMVLSDVGLVDLFPIIGLTMLVGLPLLGYALAGVRGAGLTTPIIIMLIAAVLFFGELLLWMGLLFNIDALPLQILCGLAIVAIPVISTVTIVALGRRRRANRSA